MKKMVFALVVLLILLSAIPALARRTDADPSELYESAMIAVTFEDYEKALNYFEDLEKIPGQPPSRTREISKWISYCSGMIALHKATELENKGYIEEARAQISLAQTNFELLKVENFNENSEKLYTYCHARYYELNYMKQKALDMFAELAGTEDSLERYMRIKKNIPLPTQAPSTKVPAVLPAIAAHAEMRINAYYGPGPSYSDQDAILINAETTLNIRGREGSYYMIEATRDGKKVRCWANDYRIWKDDDAAVPTVGDKAKNCYLTRQENAYYGPGDDYLKAGFSVAKGTKVKALDSEGLYTMIEFTPASPGKKVRVWVSTDSLSN